MFSRLLVLAACYFFCSTPILAQSTPDVLVKNVSTEVLTTINKEKRTTREELMPIIETKIVPHFNFPRMAALVVGKTWRQASDEQKQKFIQEFRKLLVRTYYTSLNRYRYFDLEYRPFIAKADEAEVSVVVDILRPGAEALSVEYKFDKVTGNWKIYDVIFDGLSFVTIFRGILANEVRDNNLDSLTRYLSNKNS